jgi:ferredoxin
MDPTRIEQGKKGGLRLVGSGTRGFIREAISTRDYHLGDLIHGYVYGRWPFLYIAIGTGEHPLTNFVRGIGRVMERIPFRRKHQSTESVGMAESYHGKVISTDVARKLVSVQQDIDIPDLEQVIPYSKARSLILKNPDHIIALDCPCRSSRSNPCLPLDVCLIIGEPFAGFVRQHHPERTRWVSAQEAERILLEEHERGHVHHAFFKDAMLNRFYAICNCCTCCCGAMEAMRNNSPMLASSGYVCVVSVDECIGCGDCESICPFDAIEMDEGYAVVSRESCMGCGVCVDQCVQAALALELAPDRGLPLKIEDLLQMANDAE